MAAPHPILWIVILITYTIPSGHACSSFVLKQKNAILLGKNFDWTFDKGILIKNLRNTNKIAYFTHKGQPATWTSKYGSLTFNQNGKDMPYGGMNEKGLVVEMLWLEETRFNLTGKNNYVNELEWIQYQLDNFQTVAEVVASIEQIKIYPIKGKIHYILADASGKSVIIEYLDGKANIYEKETNECQAITNNTVKYSEKFKYEVGNAPKKNTSEIYRYHVLENQITKLSAADSFSEKTAFQMLRRVTIPKGDFKTVWSIVYNIEKKIVSFYSHSHKKTKQINLNHLDFQNTISSFDINQDKELILDGKLEPLSESYNFKFVSASLTHLGFDTMLSKEISAHQFLHETRNQSWFAENYFHFNINIPMTEAGKLLVFAIMDSEEKFRKRQAVTSGFLSGNTTVGTAIRHIYGMRNGAYSMIALLDENKNYALDFDANGNPIERFATFNVFSPKSMNELTFQNTSRYFTKDNAETTVEWR